MICLYLKERKETMIMVDKTDKVKRPLIFEMYADVKMNRPVDDEKDYVSPGGYDMQMGNKIIHFDFKNSSVTIDKKDPSIIHIENRNPDYYEFPDLKCVTINLLRQVVDIPEFFIFTGMPRETDLKPVKLLNCAFYLPFNDYKNIEVSSEVCDEATICSCIL